MPVLVVLGLCGCNAAGGRTTFVFSDLQHGVLLLPGVFMSLGVGTEGLEMYNYIFSPLTSIQWPVGALLCSNALADAMMLLNGTCGAKVSAPASRSFRA